MSALPRLRSVRTARAAPWRLLLGATCAALACTAVRLTARAFAFVGPQAAPLRGAALRVVRRGMLDSFDFKGVEEMMKNPEKVKAMQKDMEEMMKDPEKVKLFQKQQESMMAAVEKLKDDPDMKDFFADIQKDGFEALKKYESDPKVLRKFSEATGGPAAMMNQMGGMPGMGGMGAPPPAVPAMQTYKPGDEVFIRGLSKAPELNGKKAMVVPPTSEEKKTLEGTGRLIVRLLDTGDQFAVKPDNLRTSAEEADAVMSNSLEDISMYNPAIQSEAAKLRESGKLDELQNDPELKEVFADIKKNGMKALEKYWSDEKLMAKISKAMAMNPMK